MERKGWVIRICILLLLGSVGSQFARPVSGEEPWEFAPYRIRVWVLMDDHPVLNQGLWHHIEQDVISDAELVDKSAWQIRFESAPAEYRHLIARGVEAINITDKQKASRDIRHGDRIAFLHISEENDSFVVKSRQFDCQTHLWGPTATRITPYPTRIPRMVFEVLRDTLVPVAKIEKIEGKYVRLRVRAKQIMKRIENGELVPNTSSPAWIDLNSVFMPVVRLNDKDGYIRIKDGIKVYDWTYLFPVEEVRSDVVETESYIKAEIHGAKRAPLAGRTNRAQRKFALVVRPTLSQTKLTIFTRDKTPRPIPDKKIYVKYPGQKDSTPIGRTNENGEIIIKPNEHPLHLVYIKSGEKRVLARLPIVPGYYETLTTDMKDDKVRLRAEGVLAGLEFNLMDLTIRREVLALRIRTALSKKDASEARRIYNEKFMALETQDSFDQRISKAIEELNKNLDDQNLDDARQKELIVKMFGDFRILVQSKLAGDLAGTLNREITTVENGGVYKPGGDNLDTSEIDKSLKEEDTN